MAKTKRSSLSLQQLKFADAYAADPRGIGKHAALVAGYSRKHAADAAHRLLKNPLIVAEIARHKAAIRERSEFDAAEAMRRLDSAADFMREHRQGMALAQIIKLQMQLAGLLIDRAQVEVKTVDISSVLIEARKRSVIAQIPSDTEYAQLSPTTDD